LSLTANTEIEMEEEEEEEEDSARNPQHTTQQ
jgi:hypothetical protein